MKKEQNVKKTIVLCSLFFVLCSVWAQEEGRPLRNTAPTKQAPTLNTQSSVPYSPLHNLSSQFSLLTDEALEQPMTQHYIEHYSSARGIITLNAIMARAYYYLPFIIEEVEQRNLPMELAYLPVIESGFQITAKSKSGAMGLWQFMMNSISPYDMKVTDLIDERRDFIKSTKGALQKLENEHKKLDCWELTLAAYNSGFNAITRVVQRTGSNDYWELSENKELRPETLHFVPKLFAAVYVLSQPRRYGINVWQRRFEWEAVTLPRQVSLDIIAEETGIRRETLRLLNAELLHGISPPDSNYKLKIPAAYTEQVTALLDRQDLRLIRYYHHIVRHGDTLWSMSRSYGASISMIEQHNPSIKDRYLKIGETIIIPAYGDVSAVLAAPARPAAAPQNYPGTHIVQKGESFWSLSRVYGVDPQVLAESNGMTMNQILHEGRTIKVPIIE